MRLELESVSKAAGRKTLLDGVSFAVDSGEFCAVIGPTGCGKTTLLRLADLLARPTSGTIMLDGVDHARAGSAACTRTRRRMAMVMQRPCMLKGTVRRNVEAGLRFRGTVPAPGRVEAGLSAVGLDGFAWVHQEALGNGRYASGPVPRSEILLTASITDRSRIVSRRTNIYYTVDEDRELYWNQTSRSHNISVVGDCGERTQTCAR